MFQDFIKSIFAGIMIGIAGVVYLSIDIPWVGALFFSIGLIMICLSNYNLYTGKVGYIQSIKDIPTMIQYIIGNFIGVSFVAAISPVAATVLVAKKLTIPLLLVFLKSVGCGILMFLAVDNYKKYNSIIPIICCVSAFIIAGFEHSIADLFYFATVGNFNIPFIVITIIGNAIGAILSRSSVK